MENTSVIELKYPHGFLVWKGKQKAIASDKQLEDANNLLVVCEGEAFGYVDLELPAAEMNVKEFDRVEWSDLHCITPRERRQWWHDADRLFVYRIVDWRPFENAKLHENGEIVDEPKPTKEQKQLIEKSQELPKQITLTHDVVSIADNGKFFIDSYFGSFPEVASTLKATYEIDVKEANEDANCIPLYSLALIRNPKLRVSKKSVIQENEKQEVGTEGSNMPWKIEERSDEFCVIKEDDNEVEGCHETREEANAQLAALNTAESEKEVNEPELVETRAKETETWLNRVKNAWKALGDLLNLEKEAKENLPFETNSGFMVKTVNGQLWHFTWSTNAFMDRDQEIFSTKSLENFVLENEKRAEKGFFNFWHIPGTDFAKKEWQGVVGRFLVESGPYLDSESGQSAKQFFSKFTNEHPEIAPEGWGCSPEFMYLPEERKTGIYENIHITRTSTLPRMKAANIWTESKQAEFNDMLTDEQRKAAEEIFGKEQLKAMLDEGSKKTEQLENDGVAHKQEQKEKTENQEKLEIDVKELASLVSGEFNKEFESIAQVVNKLGSTLKNVSKRLQKLEGDKKLKDEFSEMSRFQLAMKRASEAEETAIADDDKLLDQKPAEAKANSSDGSMAGHFFTS